MADRYFVEQPIEGVTARLIGPEAHHLAHVMRAKPGHEVVLFDGTGGEFAARVERVGRAEIELSLGPRLQIDRESQLRITLGVALPKGDRPRWLVEKAVELGVDRVVPLVTARGNPAESPSVLAKLRRAVVEASKQCGRNRLMEVSEPTALADYLRETKASHRWLGQPGGERLSKRASLANDASDVAIAIGPEGGFAPDEVALAVEQGWQLVDLGPRILRVETAALALVAVTEELLRGNRKS